MSIEKEISKEKKTSRAYNITIDKVVPQDPKIKISYTNDAEFLGVKSFSIVELVKSGVVSQDEVNQVEVIFKKIADANNPYN